MKQSTPMMLQYREIKNRFPDAVVFFRMGDFYELFFDDAKIANKVIGLTLTKRGKDAGQEVPLAGFPHHQLDNYLRKMTSKGFKVAVVDQLEDPRIAKGVVKRGVTQIATAGTVVLEQTLDEKHSRYLCAIKITGEKCGIACIESASGEFFAYEIMTNRLETEVSKISPSEILYPKDQKEEIGWFKSRFANIVFTAIDEWHFEENYGREILQNHFKTISLKGYGIDDLTLAITSAGAALHYLTASQLGQANQVVTIRRGHPEETVLMSQSTMKHLELIYPLDLQNGKSLFQLLDGCSTPMGSRLLRLRCLAPIRDKIQLEKRYEQVEVFMDELLSQKVTELLSQIGDLHRASGRIAANRGTPKDTGLIRDALQVIPDLFDTIKHVSLFQSINDWSSISHLKQFLLDSLQEKLPTTLSEGGIIRTGYNQELDKLRNLSGKGKEALKEFQVRERKRTGIEKLTVDFNRVYGYYIELTRSSATSVPSDYKRIQSLVNAERYKTDELQKFENEVLFAEDKAIDLEIELFSLIREEIGQRHSLLIQLGDSIAEIDVSVALARVAKERNYTKPILTEHQDLKFIQARHPVIEAIQPSGEVFIPNDVLFNKQKRLLLITGPNMAGKSTFLRMVGLNVILAQMGSFIPAEYAEIGIVDRLFTRIGASDNLTSGESTFLVEMNEASYLINNATSQSLILLDEVGRGTSTFDGLSIAWAMVERLATQPNPPPRTLFATHYHELTVLEEHLEAVENWNVLVKETKDSILFLRKISKGSCNRSYGIHVARMAGMPPEVVHRAEIVLELLQTGTLAPQSAARLAMQNKKQIETIQLSLFDVEEVSIRNEISNIEPEELTPLQALQILSEWKQKYSNRQHDNKKTLE